MIGSFLVKLGTWLEKHFPEKISTGEVYAEIAAIELRLHDVTKLEDALKVWSQAVDQQNDQLAALSKKVEVLTSENSALKAASALRMRTTYSVPMPGR